MDCHYRGLYPLYFHDVSASSEIEMDGSEDGVLMAIPASGICRPMHRATRGTYLMNGGVLTSGGDRKTIEPGETLVMDPMFQRPTRYFTKPISSDVITQSRLAINCRWRETSSVPKYFHRRMVSTE
jgi:hypothetical protein